MSQTHSPPGYNPVLDTVPPGSAITPEIINAITTRSKITDEDAIGIQSLGLCCGHCGRYISKVKANYGYAMSCGCAVVYLPIKGAPRGKPFTTTQNPATKATNMSAPPPIFQAKIAASKPPSVPVQQPSGFSFPLTKAYALATAARQALKSQTSSMSFGHRKLENWAMLSAMIVQDALVDSHEEAVALAYHMTVVAREVEATRKFAAELFNAKFGGTHDVDQPTKPFTQIIDFAVKRNIPLYLTGEPGVGKTYSLLDSLRRQNRDPIRVQGSGELVKADIEGSTGYAEGVGTVWTDGALVTAVRSGRPFVFDELDKSRDDVLSVLTALLESHDGTITISATGERVHPAPGYGLFATGNTVGLGEGVQYEGTRVINEAIRDRFYFLTVGYMSDKVAKNLVARSIAQYGAQVQ